VARAAAAVALGLLPAVAPVVAAGAAPTQSVTLLDVRRFWSAECNCFKLQFSGRISSGAASEYVAIMQQKCGRETQTAVGGASTSAGGSWIAEVGLPFSHDSATYRARWEGHASDSWTLRPPIILSQTAQRLARGRYRVVVYADVNMQTLTGRRVNLERLAAGRWVLVRRVPLVRYTLGPGSYTATFAVRKRGLRMRVAVPADVAEPCYSAALTKTFRS
jgi:hypothetical protein